MAALPESEDAENQHHKPTKTWDARAGSEHLAELGGGRGGRGRVRRGPVVVVAASTDHVVSLLLLLMILLLVLLQLVMLQVGADLCCHVVAIVVQLPKIETVAKQL